ncbi:MAG TPA: HAD hydrolase family protein [Thermoguttaceae bacterium]|nr:HAD hydrolase family protein [Thermoguttaceae bacterium]
MSLEQRCHPIELILSDIDGVLTDGRLIFDNQGVESKAFHARDGQGICLWRKSGRPFGLVTLRDSRIVRDRAAELEIDILRQGVTDKLAAVEKIREELDLRPEQICYLGDDLPDVRVLGYVGLGVAVADACQEARQAARHVTTLPGGGGAVREAIEMILRAQGRWTDVIRNYVG